MGSLRASEKRSERPASMGSLERHASTANARRIRLCTWRKLSREGLGGDILPVFDRGPRSRLLGTTSRASSVSTSSDRLPKLDAISFWVGEPAELSKIVAVAFGIDRDTFVYQTVQHSIEVIHLEVDHHFLCRRKVFVILSEEGKDDLS